MGVDKIAMFVGEAGPLASLASSLLAQRLPLVQDVPHACSMASDSSSDAAGLGVKDLMDWYAGPDVPLPPSDRRGHGRLRIKHMKRLRSRAPLLERAREMVEAGVQTHADTALLAAETSELQYNLYKGTIFE